VLIYIPSPRIFVGRISRSCGRRPESLRETAYLMRSPANARRLLDAMERLESGQGEAHDVIEAVDS